MALHQEEEEATPNPNPSERKKTTTTMTMTMTTTKKQWRFTWETLAHTPTLRLYLFRSPGSTDPLPCCSHLRASLCLVESLLLVSFLDLEAPAPASSAAAVGRQVVLRVPVPRVLIDPGCPVECVAKSDHFEIKLALIVPVDHPLIKEFRGALDSDRDVMGSSDYDQVLLSMNDGELSKFRYFKLLFPLNCGLFVEV